MLSLASSDGGFKASSRGLNERVCRCLADFNSYVNK